MAPSTAVIRLHKLNNVYTKYYLSAAKPTLTTLMSQALFFSASGLSSLSQCLLMHLDCAPILIQVGIMSALLRAVEITACVALVLG